ncbi:uncharacterized protein LOC113773736 [Coffea eugenioides]|uniref:uncharacterized protein LOC113773736 n=1 Tax=Coffea eugenioides TaxID=49369 RepID=UPI000F609B96|nr:uncharacterized protein LOC113773736 [Coffea eugenioides]
MSQLASSLSNFENGKGKLPSQVISNLKENASAMPLRSGKDVQSSKLEATRDGDEQVSDEPKKEKLSKYAKFLKGLCTNRNKLNLQDKVKVGENVSAVLQRKLPQKCKDPGIFTIPCIIGQKRIERGMLDLRASINVMPLSIFKTLNLGPLKETRVVIQLADRSNVYPEGVVEDVLVKVNEFIFPANFYIVNMNDDNSANSVVLLLGRPFMSTSKTNEEVESVDDEDTVEAVMSLHSLSVLPDRSIDSFLPLPTPNERILPSVEQTPKLELKELPKHLKYAYLGDHNTLPVIIANDLTAVQEEKLLRVLQEYKSVIYGRWRISKV